MLIASSLRGSARRISRELSSRSGHPLKPNAGSLLSLAPPDADTFSARAAHFPFLRAIERRGTAALSLSSSKGSSEETVSSAPPRTAEESSTPRAVQPPRSLGDSVHRITLPLGTDSKLRDTYLSYLGDVRLGKVLEDLDAFAGGAAYDHIGADPSGSDTIAVTASVDRITIRARPRIDEDLRYVGGVEWVGKSSMSIAIRVETRTAPDEAPDAAGGGAPAAEWREVLESRFTMVALDAVTGKAVPVPRLALSGAEEEAQFAAAEEAVAAQRRLTADLKASIDAPPSREELELVHKLIMRHGPAQVGACTTASTRMTSTLIMHPQQRNVHGKVFGGFLMRAAYEQAFAAALSFNRSPPEFLAVDDIHFIAPVDIGRMVKFTATVDHAQPPYFTIAVSADVVDPASGSTVRTTTFFFTFKSPTTRTVVPETYVDALANVAARKILALSVGG